MTVLKCESFSPKRIFLMLHHLWKMVDCLIVLRQGRFGHSIRRVRASAEREPALSHLAHQTHPAPHDRVHKGGTDSIRVQCSGPVHYSR